jgi:hypothetical protein
MKPHGPISIVRKWRVLSVDPVLRRLDDSEGLNNGYLRSGCSP